jgi:hypothetical protein
MNKNQLKKDIIDYLWDKKIDDFSAEDMLFLYRDISDTFFSWKLKFDVIDDYCDELYIICSFDTEISENKRISIVLDRNVRSSDITDTVETMLRLNEESETTENYFKF